MNLVMFDIDGTLTDTNEVDKQCYVQALLRDFSRGRSDTDWTQYEDSTDQGCLEEFARRHMGARRHRKRPRGSRKLTSTYWFGKPKPSLISLSPFQVR